MSDKPAEVEETKKVPDGFVVALDGDTYASIAERLGKGFTAESVFKANLEAPLYPGALVKVK